MLSAALFMRENNMHYFTEETIRSVLVAVVTTHGTRTSPADLIKETVDALIAVDRKLNETRDSP